MTASLGESSGQVTYYEWVRRLTVRNRSGKESVLVNILVLVLGFIDEHGPGADGRLLRKAVEARGPLRLMYVYAIIIFLALSSMSGHPLMSQTSTVTAQTPRPWDQNSDGMRIYIWAGLKSHYPGQHDYPQFLADWSKILTEHGAVVDGALHAPHAADLERTDVVIIYKGDAGYLSDEEKAALETYVKRGGGLVSLHDSLCGPDPVYFASLLGGAKKHGDVNYTLDAPVPYTVVDGASPVMKGMSNFTLFDEAFYNMTWAPDPGIHVLATTAIAGTPSAGVHKGEVVPQIWTYEHALAGGERARAFVWMQGHAYANFANYQIQQMLLRGIAWAGKKPVDSLLEYVPAHPPRTQGPASNQ
jgi:type 1 glutamine amidotransferase